MDSGVREGEGLALHHTLGELLAIEEDEMAIELPDRNSPIADRYTRANDYPC